jgi:cation transport ATPase
LTATTLFRPFPWPANPIPTLQTKRSVSTNLFQTLSDSASVVPAWVETAQHRRPAAPLSTASSPSLPATEELPVHQLDNGDRVLVRPGARAAADAQLLRAESIDA